MRFGLEEHIIKKINQVFEANPKVDKAIVFGSRAKGNYREDSDIDIAIKGYDLSLDDVLKMSIAIEETGVGKKIDLIDYHGIKEEALIEHIDRVGVEMYSRWKEYALKNVIETFIDYRGKTPTKTTTGIPLITAKIVKNGRIHQPTEFIDQDDYFNWMTRGFPNVNDIVLTTEAPLGEVALIKDINVALAQRIITLQTNKELCNSIFLKYYIESPEGQYSLHSKASGSTVEGIKSAELKNIIVKLPPIKEQLLISSILSSLDDKIDLLHRQNKTLEKMAETLFRQWFVVEAEEEWEEVTMNDVAFINQRSISKDFQYSTIEYLDTGSITEGRISEYQLIPLKNAPSRAQRLVKDNDIIYSLVRPIQRHYGLLSGTKSNTVVSTGFCVITCKEGFCPYFIYLLLSLDENVEFFESIAEGSTSAYPSLRPADLGNFEFLHPPKDKLIKFTKIASNFWEKINRNTKQMQSLTQLRDSLLPKLMSGEVRVEM